MVDDGGGEVSDPRCLIDIDIYLDGYLYGTRYWPAVPRVGDLIALRLNGGELEAEVSSVVWSETQGASLAIQRPMVRLHVHRTR